MRSLNSLDEIERIAVSCGLLSEVMDEVIAAIDPGVSTGDLDELAASGIRSRGAEAAFPVVPSPRSGIPFGGTICASVNEQIVHGVPSAKQRLQVGDVLSVDCGLVYDGFYADMARTIPVGGADENILELIEEAKAALDDAIEATRPGNRLGDIGYAVQRRAEQKGFGLIREFTGHAIGRCLHEEPQVPNWGTPGRGERLRVGMVLAIEPMLTLGTHETETLDDDWTVVTRDRSIAVHVEDTVAITEDGPRNLTRNGVW